MTDNQQQSDELLEKFKRGLVRTWDEQGNTTWVDPLIAMAEVGVPEHLRGGLRRYLVDHIPPGDFLMAVLANDLRDAMGRADENSRAGLFQLVTYLHNYAPSAAWGSRKTVSTWLKQRTVFP